MAGGGGGGGGALRVVLGDQCSRTLSALRDLDPATDVVLLAEVRAECTYVRHHKQKIALVLSAMRHFARALAARGVRVEHVRLEDEGNTGTLAGEVARAVARHRPARIVGHAPRRVARAGGHARLGGADRPAGRDPRRRPLPLPARLVPAMGAGGGRRGRRPGHARRAPHGVLLPRHAPQHRPADGRRRAGRRRAGTTTRRTAAASRPASPSRSPAASRRTRSPAR